MKTTMKRLKLAVLSLGFLALFSCTGDVTGSAAFWNYTYGRSSQKVKVITNDSGKLLPVAVLPIFFGTIEATLSSK